MSDTKTKETKETQKSVCPDTCSCVKCDFTKNLDAVKKYVDKEWDLPCEEGELADFVAEQRSDYGYERGLMVEGGPLRKIWKAFMDEWPELFEMEDEIEFLRGLESEVCG